MTLYKIERGNPGVPIAAYAIVLFVLGLVASFAELADAKFDEIGFLPEQERLPKRIHFKSSLLHGKPDAEQKQ